MRRLNQIFTSILLCIMPLGTYAQIDSAYAKLDTNVISIGDQISFRLTFTGASRSNTVFPIVPDTFSSLEIVKRGQIDTVSDVSGIRTLSQSFVITGFDSGYHVIKPFEFKTIKPGEVDTQTVVSQPLLLQVKTLDVDTTAAFKDIKPIEEVPSSIWDYLPWILLMAGIITGFIFLVKYLKSRKPKSKPEYIAPVTPSHIKALNALEELERKGLWQQGKHRAFHTELTDILRIFISERWNIGAMEMTTDEIMSLSFITNTGKTDGIGYILHMADLVKFAKGIPLGDENQRCLALARSFVNSNAPIPTSTETNGQS
ncbi:MAG: hypothetical protein ACK5C5_10795 [Bacteroidota bacterium]|jgi:hypothetical protein